MLRGFEAQVTAGIHQDDGGKQHSRGVTNADVGSFHEFGFGPPQRSWLRAYFDENEDRLGLLMEDAVADSIIKGTDIEQSLGLIAVQIEGEIKERILAGIEPELSESTKRKRGEAAVPLLATSQMLGAIRAELQVRFT